MAVKKKPAAKQKKALAVARKPIVAPKPRKKAVRPRKDRRSNVPRPTFIQALWGGIHPQSGKAFVDISIDSDAHLETLIVTVNGKGIWEGQP